MKIGRALVLTLAGLAMAAAYTWLLSVYSGVVLYESHARYLTAVFVGSAILSAGLSITASRWRPGLWWAGYLCAAIIFGALLPLISLPSEVRIPGDGHEHGIEFEARESALLDVNATRVIDNVDIGEGGKARFAIRLEGNPGQPPALVEVFVRESMSSPLRKIFSAEYDRVRTRWEEIEVDLASHAGKNRTLAIRVTDTSPAAAPDRVMISRVDLGAGGGTGEALKRPNVIVIVVDTLRPDHLSTYGYGKDVDPNLRALWKQRGARFDRAYSTTSWTTPADVSILTSLYPAEAGISDVRHMVLSQELVTLPELLRRSGYATAGFSMTHLVSSDLNFHQGFDRFYDLAAYSFHPDGDRAAINSAGTYLAERPDKPFFLFFHLMNPHYPYSRGLLWEGGTGRPARAATAENYLRSMAANFWGRLFFPRPPFSEKELFDNAMMEDYDGEIGRVDAALAALFDLLSREGLWENTVVIVTADHGEEFNEHGGFGHMSSLHGEQNRVPLIVAGPMVKTGGAGIECPASLLDIMPTVLEAARAPVPAEARGVSLWKTIASGECAARPLFAELDLSPTGGAVWESVILDDVKLIKKTVSGETSFEAYDLARDPGETVNLQGELLLEVHRGLVESFSARRAQLVEDRPDSDLTEERRKILESLGYL